MSNRITEIGRMSDRVMHFVLMLLFASYPGKEFGIDKFFIKRSEVVVVRYCSELQFSSSQ